MTSITNANINDIIITIVRLSFMMPLLLVCNIIVIIIVTICYYHRYRPPFVNLYFSFSSFLITSQSPLSRSLLPYCSLSLQLYLEKQFLSSKYIDIMCPWWFFFSCSTLHFTSHNHCGRLVPGCST